MGRAKVRVGFIGVGQISDLHQRAYRLCEEVELMAIADCNQALLQRRGQQWNISRCYCDYRELLACKDIDAVEVLVPHPFHEEVVLAAAAAGKHVSCQKPLSTSLAAAQRMLRACQQNGLIFKLYENYLFYPPLVKAHALLQAGLIGRFSLLRMKVSAAGSGGWQVADSSWAWRQQETLAQRGQQTFDHGHHLWALALTLGGEVSRVRAQIFVRADKLDSPANIAWQYAQQGCYGSCDYSYAPALTMPSDYYACDELIELSGDNGLLLVYGCSGRLYQHLPPLQSFTSQEGWRDYHCERDWASSFDACSLNFFQALLGRAEPYPDAHLAYQILAFDLAISESAASKKEVELPAPAFALD